MYVGEGINSSCNSITQELPRNVAAVGSAAKTLDATNNRLKEVGNIEGLVNLQRLILARNQISELPSSLGSLQQLKVSTSLCMGLTAALLPLPLPSACRWCQKQGCMPPLLVKHQSGTTRVLSCKSSKPAWDCYSS